MSVKNQIEKSLLYWINDNANSILFKEEDNMYIYLTLSENPNNILFFNDASNEICKYIIEPGYLELYEEIFGFTSKDTGIIKMPFPEFRSKRGLIK